MKYKLFRVYFSIVRWYNGHLRKVQAGELYLGRDDSEIDTIIENGCWTGVQFDPITGKVISFQ